MFNSEANLPWRKSSFSGQNGCVEIAWLVDDRIAVRDSKNPDFGFFIYDANEWRAFLAGVRNGEFDGPIPPFFL